MKASMTVVLAGMIFGMGLFLPVFAQDDAPAKDAEKVLLRWALKEGDLLRYEMTNLVDTSVQGMKMEQKIIFGMKQEILEVDDKGAAQIKVTYDRVAINMTGMMMAEYDSDIDKDPPADNPLVPFFAAFVGENFQMKMDPRGKVLEVEGMNEMMGRIIKRLGESNAMMGEMLKQQYNEDQMKDQMQQGFAVLPEQAVGVGDTWDTEMETAMGVGGGVMVMKTANTLKEIDREKNLALVEQKTEITMGEAVADDPMAGMVKIKEAEGKSLMNWDLAQGRLSSTKGSVVMEMESAGMPMTVTTTMNMQLAPRDEEKKTPTGSSKEGEEKK